MSDIELQLESLKNQLKELQDQNDKVLKRIGELQEWNWIIWALLLAIWLRL